MRSKLAFFALLVLSARGCDCTAKTQRIDEPDATPLGHLDAGSEECARAEECPGSARPCNGASCGCGTFKFCREGRCLLASAECPRDASTVDTGFPDAGNMRCTSPADCSGAAETVAVCGSAAYSCIDHSCVWECEGGRACEVPNLGDCIECEDTFACPQVRCGIAEQNATIEAATEGCDVYPRTAALIPGAKARLFSTARPCSTALEIEGVGLVGTFIEYDDFRYVGHFPELGGTCTGVQAPTGAIRFIFSCPLCQFVVGP